MKRTQGIMQAVKKTALLEANLTSKIAMYVYGTDINGSEANTWIIVMQDYSSLPWLKGVACIKRSIRNLRDPVCSIEGKGKWSQPKEDKMKAYGEFVKLIVLCERESRSHEEGVDSDTKLAKETFTVL